MKALIFLIPVLLLAVACHTPRETGTNSGMKTAAEVLSDSTEYEITIIDPDFETWYQLNYSPAKERSESYYESMNVLGVNNWNIYFMRNRYPSVIGSHINYIPNHKYGIEVNRKLYWYFVYIESALGINLLH